MSEGLKPLGGKFRPGDGEADLIRPDGLVGFFRPLKEQSVVFVDGGVAGIEADRFDMLDFGSLFLLEAGERDRKHEVVPPFAGIELGRAAEVISGKDKVFPGILRRGGLLDQNLTEQASEARMLRIDAQSAVGDLIRPGNVFLNQRVLAAEPAPLCLPVLEEHDRKKNPASAGSGSRHPSRDPPFARVPPWGDARIGQNPGACGRKKCV